MNEIHANFYWFITATPYSIIDLHKNSRTGFVKDIMNDMFDSGGFTDIIIKNRGSFTHKN